MYIVAKLPQQRFVREFSLRTSDERWRQTLFGRALRGPVKEVIGAYHEDLYTDAMILSEHKGKEPIHWYFRENGTHLWSGTEPIPKGYSAVCDTWRIHWVCSFKHGTNTYNEDGVYQSSDSLYITIQEYEKK